MSLNLNLHRSRVRTHGDAGGAIGIKYCGRLPVERGRTRCEVLEGTVNKTTKAKSLEAVGQPSTQTLRAGIHRATGHGFGSSCDTPSLRSG